MFHTFRPYQLIHMLTPVDTSFSKLFHRNRTFQSASQSESSNVALMTSPSPTQRELSAIQDANDAITMLPICLGADSGKHQIWLICATRKTHMKIRDVEWRSKTIYDKIFQSGSTHVSRPSFICNYLQSVTPY